MEHHFNTEHAKTYGVEEAIVINSFIHWIEKNRANRVNLQDGRTWTYNSLSALAELFPYWTRRQLERITKSLIDQGVLCARQLRLDKGDQRLWYAFREEQAFLAFAPGDRHQTVMVSTGGPSPNRDGGPSPNGDDHHQTVTPPSPNGDGPSPNGDGHSKNKDSSNAQLMHSGVAETRAGATPAADPNPQAAAAAGYQLKSSPERLQAAELWVGGGQQAVFKWCGAMAGDEPYQLWLDAIEQYLQAGIRVDQAFLERVTEIVWQEFKTKGRQGKRTMGWWINAANQLAIQPPAPAPTPAREPVQPYRRQGPSEEELRARRRAFYERLASLPDDHPDVIEARKSRVNCVAIDRTRERLAERGEPLVLAGAA